MCLHKLRIRKQGLRSSNREEILMESGQALRVRTRARKTPGLENTWDGHYTDQKLPRRILRPFPVFTSEWAVPNSL